MDTLPYALLAWLMVIASGVMAGVYLTFSMVVMRSLALLEDHAGVAAMNSINRTIVRTGFMPLFFGSTVIAALMIVTGLWFIDTAGGIRALSSGLIYFVGMFLVTALRNVPLNQQLDQVSESSSDLSDIWHHYLSVWTRWNTVRSVACLAAMGLALTLV